MSEQWMEQGQCQHADPSMFVDARNSRDVEKAKRVCAICPVVEECLEFALACEGDETRSNRFGIYGGLTPGERIRINRQRRRAGAA